MMFGFGWGYGEFCPITLNMSLQIFELYILMSLSKFFTEFPTTYERARFQPEVLAHFPVLGLNQPLNALRVNFPAESLREVHQLQVLFECRAFGQVFPMHQLK